MKRNVHIKSFVTGEKYRPGMSANAQEMEIREVKEGVWITLWGRLLGLNGEAEGSFSGNGIIVKSSFLDCPLHRKIFALQVSRK